MSVSYRLQNAGAFDQAHDLGVLDRECRVDVPGLTAPGAFQDLVVNLLAGVQQEVFWEKLQVPRGWRSAWTNRLADIMNASPTPNARMSMLPCHLRPTFVHRQAPEFQFRLSLCPVKIHCRLTWYRCRLHCLQPKPQ